VLQASGRVGIVFFEENPVQENSLHTKVEAVTSLERGRCYSLSGWRGDKVGKRERRGDIDSALAGL